MRSEKLFNSRMGESSKKKHNDQLKSYMDDPDVKSLATSIRKRAEDVNNIRKKEGFSIAFLKEVTRFVYEETLKKRMGKF